MKIINDLTVSVTYAVSLVSVEVPDDVYEQLMKCSEFSFDDLDNFEAMEWLKENINENDATDWSCEVDEF